MTDGDVNGGDERCREGNHVQELLAKTTSGPRPQAHVQSKDNQPRSHKASTGDQDRRSVSDAPRCRTTQCPPLSITDGQLSLTSGTSTKHSPGVTSSKTSNSPP